MSLLSENVGTVVSANTIVTNTLELPVDTIYNEGVTYVTYEGTVNTTTTAPVNGYYFVIDNVTGMPIDLAGKVIQTVYYSTGPALTGPDLDNVFFEDRYMNSLDLNVAIPFWYVYPPKSAQLINNNVWEEGDDFDSYGAFLNTWRYMALFKTGAANVTGGTIHIKVTCLDF